MAARSFAGFQYRDRVSVGFYGEVFRAHSASHQEVRLLHVDPELGAVAGFAEALARFGTDLAQLKDRNVVTTRTMGRDEDGALVVVTDPVSGPVSVSALLDDAHSGLPPEVAVTVARGVVAGLASAHRLAVVHGCIHPRSVHVDFDGNVKVGDFAVARALASCSARAGGHPLAEAARDFLAPELAFGSEPTMRSDVYAAGALLDAMLGGQSLPVMNGVMERALHHHAERRFRDAVEMAAAIDHLIESGAVSVMSASKLARFIRELRAAVDCSLDDSTDDLLSAITGGGKGASPVHMDALLDSLDEEIGDEPTRVDDSLALRARDPISELIELQGTQTEPPPPRRERDDDTPLPAPVAAHELSLTRDGADILAGTGTRKRLAAAEADAAIASLELENDTGGAPPRAAAPEIALGDEQLVSMSRSRGWFFWLAIIGAALGGVLVYLYTQTDVFHPERARRERDQKRKEREAAIRAFNASQPRGGRIAVTSEPEGAAVWWKLGRTPLQTRPMRADAIHQIRIEYDAHVPRDVNVSAKHWSGSGESMRAIVTAKLARGDRARAPAAPPKPPASTRGGPAGGKGVISVKSTPAGAEVWLLVGFTGYFEGLESQAGLEYELKVLKKGYQPAYVVVHKQDWQEGGDTGELRSRIDREVELTRLRK